MKNRSEIKKEKQQEGLNRLYELMATLEAKNMTVADVTKKANIDGNRLYELLRKENPRGLNNLSSILEKLEILATADIDMNVQDYTSLNQKIDKILLNQDVILQLLKGR